MTDELAWFGGPQHESFELGGDAPRAGALLLHGFPGTPAELLPLGQALSSAGVAARAPLLPGFGPEMDRLGEVGARDWLASASEVWTSVRSTHTQSVLVGYSMGGALALRLAAVHPPHRLVLVAPLWRLLGPAWPLGKLLPVVERVVPSFGLLDHGSALDNPELRHFFARAAPELDLDHPEVRAELRRRVRVRTTTIAQLWQLAIGSGAAAREVRVPTLILQGKADRVVRPHDTRELARRFGGPTQLHELEGGHLLLDSGASAWSVVRDLIVGFVTA
ncbi:MAG TPA: alpha/beta fold hydrolase [Chloroflexota bacterium]